MDVENTVFDYVIIGAGSAGCVVANRLSENGKSSVCLLEAGPSDRTPMARIPSAFPYFMYSKKYNWSYSANSDGAVRNGEPLFVPRGKMLGGSSSTNAMVYVRGQRQDYDEWHNMGNVGWSYQALLPYFIKSENNERGASEFHGDSGPVHVSDGSLEYPVSEVFLKAAEQAGHIANSDFNGSSQEGVGAYQCTIRNGVRCSASDAYLKPAKKRSNLTVITNSMVEQIVLEGNKAVGVRYTRQGQQIKLTALREVVVSGGTINSPQLLLLSGIGDAGDLAPHGIACQHHLPGVGKNLQEHVDACVLVKSKKSDGLTATLSGLIKIIPAVLRYIARKNGKLASVIIETGGFIKSREEIDRPDLQLGMVPLLFDDNGRDLKLMKDKGYSCHVCVLRPKSRGSVTLKSANPLEPPLIDFNFFSHPDDEKILINGIRQVRKILAAPAFNDYAEEELHPGIAAQSDEAILEKCKQRLGTVFHPVGTCKMGTDTMAVVDNQLKVHGIDNLRIVDASIMPKLISGNTNATTIAIAEYAAEKIMADA